MTSAWPCTSARTPGPTPTCRACSRSTRPASAARRRRAVVLTTPRCPLRPELLPGPHRPELPPGQPRVSSTQRVLRPRQYPAAASRPLGVERLRLGERSVRVFPQAAGQPAASAGRGPFDLRLARRPICTGGTARRTKPLAALTAACELAPGDAGLRLGWPWALRQRKNDARRSPGRPGRDHAAGSHHHAAPRDRRPPAVGSHRQRRSGPRGRRSALLLRLDAENRAQAGCSDAPAGYARPNPDRAGPRRCQAGSKTSALVSLMKSIRVRTRTSWRCRWPGNRCARDRPRSSPLTRPRASSRTARREGGHPGAGPLRSAQGDDRARRTREKLAQIGAVVPDLDRL